MAASLRARFQHATGVVKRETINAGVRKLAEVTKTGFATLVPETETYGRLSIHFSSHLRRSTPLTSSQTVSAKKPGIINSRSQPDP